MEEENITLTRENIRELINSIKRRSKITLLKTMIKLLGVLLVISISITILIPIFGNQNPINKYFNKSIKQEIKQVINNNANIDVVKNIYMNRKIYATNLTDLFNIDSDKEKYQSETPLSEILKDMKTDYFLTEKKDTIYLEKLNHIIKTHEIVNPFDKLEQNQKNDFENLRVKLRENYPAISSDINRITDELHNKNQLVVKYLNKSNISFLISIIALIITISVSFFQIYQNRDTRLIKILDEVINENKTKVDEKEEE